MFLILHLGFSIRESQQILFQVRTQHIKRVCCLTYVVPVGSHSCEWHIHFSLFSENCSYDEMILLMFFDELWWNLTQFPWFVGNLGEKLGSCEYSHNTKPQHLFLRQGPRKPKKGIGTLTRC